MTGKRRTPIPRPPARKRKHGLKPVTPRPKGETERLAVRRLAVMKYRLAGASYRTIAEKLTEEQANAYADEHGVSVERAMKKITHVSVRTVWDDVTAEYEELRLETEVNRADSMALEPDTRRLTGYSTRGEPSERAGKPSPKRLSFSLWHRRVVPDHLCTDFLRRPPRPLVKAILPCFHGVMRSLHFVFGAPKVPTSALHPPHPASSGTQFLGHQMSSVIGWS